MQATHPPHQPDYCSAVLQNCTDMLNEDNYCYRKTTQDHKWRSLFNMKMYQGQDFCNAHVIWGQRSTQAYRFWSRVLLQNFTLYCRRQGWHSAQGPPYTGTAAVLSGNTAELAITRFINSTILILPSSGRKQYVPYPKNN